MKAAFKILSLLCTLFVLFTQCETEPENQVLYDKALENGISANEGLMRCGAYMEAWLEYADPLTGQAAPNQSFRTR